MSNLFTGDAPTAALTMSRRARRARSPDGRWRLRGHPAASPGVVPHDVRILPGPVPGPACRPARRAAAVPPHLGRRPLLRSVTNGVLRDLNTASWPPHMLQGTRSIYVDYVDYDEIAHHAGVLRPEPWKRWRRSTACSGAGAGRRRRTPPVPLRDPVRPRPGPGRDFRRALRRRPGRPWSPGCPAPTSPPRTTTSRAGAGPRSSWTSSATGSGVERQEHAQRLRGHGQAERDHADEVQPRISSSGRQAEATRSSTSSGRATSAWSTCGASEQRLDPPRAGRALPRAW